MALPFSTFDIGTVTSNNIDKNHDGTAETYAFVLDLGDLYTRGDETIKMYKASKNIGVQHDFSALTNAEKGKMVGVNWTLVKTVKAKEAMIASTAGDKIPILRADIPAGSGYDTQITPFKFDKKSDAFSVQFLFDSWTIFVNTGTKYLAALTR